MWDMAVNTSVLFFKGKLFLHNGKVFAQIGLGLGVTALLFLGVRAAGVPPLAASGVAGFVGGGLQPWLFRNLKYL